MKRQILASNLALLAMPALARAGKPDARMTFFANAKATFMRFLLSATLAATLLTIMAGGAVALTNQTIEQGVKECVDQVHKTPGGPLHSYQWNSAFDAYYANGQFRTYGSAESGFYFEKCMRQKGLMQ